MKRFGERALAAVVTVAAMGACLQLDVPENQVASISALSVPYPTVVIGDVMRDSLGVARPISVIAYDAEGRALGGVAVQIIVLDATANTLGTSVGVDQLGYVHGLIRDTLGARVFATVGSFGAPPQRILVSVAPQVAKQSAAATAISFDITTPDTSVQTNWSPPLELTLTDGNTTGAQGFIITYEVTRSPTPTIAGVPTAYVGDDAGKASRRDTTDVKGIAGRRVILRQQAIGDAALFAGTKTDTIIVRATVKYNGADLSGTPFDYIVPVKRKP
jgi:hypothetical protein